MKPGAGRALTGGREGEGRKGTREEGGRKRRREGEGGGREEEGGREILRPPQCREPGPGFLVASQPPVLEPCCPTSIVFQFWKLRALPGSPSASPSV